MPTPIQDPTGDDVTTLTGAMLYDSIMGDIEPELLTKNMPRIAAMIAKDTQEERKDRAARYTAAFAEYEKRFAARNEDWQRTFKTFKRTANRVLEGIVAEKEQGDLSSLEASMASSSLP